MNSPKTDEKAKANTGFAPLLNNLNLKYIEHEAKETFDTVTSKFNKISGDILDLVSNKVYKADSTFHFFIVICFISSIFSILEIVCNGLTLFCSVFIFAVVLLEFKKVYPITNLVSVFVWGLIFLIGTICISYIFVFTFFVVGFIVGPFFAIVQFLYCFYLTYIFNSNLPHTEPVAEKADSKKEK